MGFKQYDSARKSLFQSVMVVSRKFHDGLLTEETAGKFLADRVRSDVGKYGAQIVIDAFDALLFFMDNNRYVQVKAVNTGRPVKMQLFYEPMVAAVDVYRKVPRAVSRNIQKADPEEVPPAIVPEVRE